MTKTKPIPREMSALPKYFDVSHDSDPAARMLGMVNEGWYIECKHCSARWRLQQKADGSVHPGNILALLNHAYGHKENDAARAS